MMTLGALVGLVPITLLFLWGIWLVFFGLYRALLTSEMIMMALLVVVVSTFCLGCGWYVYAQAMRERPQLRRHPVLLLGLVIGVLWGIGWAFIWGPELRWSHLAFLLPGVSTGVMYRVTWKRERQLLAR
ncbi:hypothetical protein [Pseudomonas aegrilactucae]|uniref:Uncharacterized protein n=1 Tax=Pseudomonas aegrilactucae TaxID=2854028 RepID=A0A9Q2XR66_9PSED|nr:hypothetical protein [Pseudomonas aegrilactucae]MBV6290470.1 hypothetical protein [Pseudomonas aegrilactucae]